MTNWDMCRKRPVSYTHLDVYKRQEKRKLTEAEVRREVRSTNPAVSYTHLDVYKRQSLDEAKQTGAMALFGEKYGDEVRVVSMGDFSKELCGGTHVHNTGDVMLFKIISESGTAAGVRRIEALTGQGVIDYYKREEEQLHEAARALKASPEDLLDKIGHLQAELKALHSENESLKSKMASESLGDVMDQVTDIKGIKLLAASVPDVDMNGLRDLGDQLKEKLGQGVICLLYTSGRRLWPD